MNINFFFFFLSFFLFIFNCNLLLALRNFGGTVKKKEHKIYGAFFREIDPNAKSTHVTFDD